MGGKPVSALTQAVQWWCVYIHIQNGLYEGEGTVAWSSMLYKVLLDLRGAEAKLYHVRFNHVKVYYTIYTKKGRPLTHCGIDLTQTGLQRISRLASSVGRAFFSKSVDPGYNIFSWLILFIYIIMQHYTQTCYTLREDVRKGKLKGSTGFLTNFDKYCALFGQFIKTLFYTADFSRSPPVSHIPLQIWLKCTQILNAIAGRV